ncbi:MAG TPA: serpin family protein [Longimicrobiales bacterium]|nr:serpin family protein [Longimicrobiales bacterium]
MIPPRPIVRRTLFPLTLAALLAAACGESPDPAGPGDDPPPRELTATERAVVADVNAFGLDLLREVHAREPAPNVFLSPLSASMALGMTLNGAAGETWEGMRAALRHDGLSDMEIGEAYRGLLDVLRARDSRVELGIANSVWAREGFPIEPDFYDAVRTWFDAEARELDFADPGAADVINAWASEQTRGRIDDVIDRIDPAHVMFLLNAVYFKGLWTTEFDPDDTRQAPFSRADGSTVQVPMMRLDNVEVPFAWTEQYAAAELPYGNGGFAMVVVVPHRSEDLGALVAELDADGWAALLAGLEPDTVPVNLPRFRLEYDTYLNGPLVDMGMGLAFSRQADFSRLTPEQVCIDFVRQKTFVEVDERGTEAAAVTVVGIIVVSLPAGLYAERPFLFAIRERHTGALLFVGTMGDPTVSEVPAEAAPGGC